MTNSSKKWIKSPGRIHSIRKSGVSLIFYDIHSNDAKIQIYANLRNHKDQKNFETHNQIRRDDFIGVIRKNPKDKEGEQMLFNFLSFYCYPKKKPV